MQISENIFSYISLTSLVFHLRNDRTQGEKFAPIFLDLQCPPPPSWRNLDYARLGYLQITASAAINLHGQ